MRDATVTKAKQPWVADNTQAVLRGSGRSTRQHGVRAKSDGCFAPGNRALRSCNTCDSQGNNGLSAKTRSSTMPAFGASAPFLRAKEEGPRLPQA